MRGQENYMMPILYQDLTMISGGENFSFLISDGINIQYRKDSLLISELKSPDKLQDILFDKTRNLILAAGRK